MSCVPVPAAVFPADSWTSTIIDSCRGDEISLFETAGPNVANLHRSLSAADLTMFIVSKINKIRALTATACDSDKA